VNLDRKRKPAKNAVFYQYSNSNNSFGIGHRTNPDFFLHRAILNGAILQANPRKKSFFAYRKTFILNNSLAFR